MYAEALNGKVYHYRDKNGLECDAVVHLRDGRYGLVEVKKLKILGILVKKAKKVQIFG